jgi:hypothetical protein
MGTYEQFMEDRAKGTRRGSGLSMEDRMDAAMNVDEAFTDARGRIQTFVDAYLVQRHQEIKHLNDPGAAIPGGEFYQIVHDSVQRLKSAGTSDADAKHLLLDDLRILLDMVGGSR